MNIRRHTRLSIMIHLIGMSLTGVAVGILLSEYVENFRVIASMGFSILGMLFILTSIHFDQKP